jgi:hypothetical protein
MKGISKAICFFAAAMSAPAADILAVTTDITACQAAAGLTSEADELKETESLCDIITYCSKQLGLQGLACLAASSKQLRKASLAVVCSDAAFLLVDTVKAAAATAALYDESKYKNWHTYKHKKALAWLLQEDPTAVKTAAPVTVQLLLLVPCVPLHVAEQLVAAGMCVSFEQVCAAARSRVAGVEVWIQAHLHMAVTSDIPRSAIEMCACTADWVSWRLWHIMRNSMMA